MLKNFHATPVDARPEDIKEPVGVSERFKNLVEEKIAEHHEAEQEPAADAAPKEDIGVVLERTAGTVGEYKVVPSPRRRTNGISSRRSAKKRKS